MGAKWSSAEILVSVPVRLGTVAILARLLTPIEFGVFAAGVTVVEFARPLGTLSMDHALVQSKELGVGTVAFASAFSLSLSVIVAAVIALNADQVLLLYDDPSVPGLLVALAWSIPLAAVSGLLLASLRRKLVFRELSIVTLVSSVMGALASIGAALAGWGLWALVAGYYADLGFKALLAVALVRPHWVQPRIGQEARGLLRFGLGSTLSLMLNFWALHGDYVVTGSVLGSKPLGYYSRAYQLISTVPGMLGRLHNTVLFPAFSRAQGDRFYLEKALRTGTEATAALMLPLSAWGLVLGSEIIQVLLGPGWEETVIAFQILSLGLYFRAAYGLSASIVFATGHVFSLSACQGIYGILIVAGALFGANWGIAGVATATLAALLVFYLLLYALAARVSGGTVRSFLGIHARPMLVFTIVMLSAALGRISLMGFDLPPIVVLGVTVAMGALALLAATRVLGRRLWGDLLYQQGLTAFGRYTPPTEMDDQENDDLGI